MKSFKVLLQILVIRWVPECFVDPVLEFEGITQMNNMLVTFYGRVHTTTAWEAYKNPLFDTPDRL